MEKINFITVITDCTDQNVRARLGTRIGALFGLPPVLIGVGGSLAQENTHDPAEFEAAGCLVDTLDAADNAKGIILVNVANRHGKGKKHTNGTPFAYFYIKQTLVISTVDGFTLSLIKKLKLADKIYIMDIPTVVGKLSYKQIISADLAEHITNTQFRSYEFQPRAAKWLSKGLDIPAKESKISEIEESKKSVWFVDNFGNCKTNILPEEISFRDGRRVNTDLGFFTCISRLKDVPDGEKALIIGSSGYNKNRFLEIVIQGKNAAKTLGIHPGTIIL